MENERNIDKLAGWIMSLSLFAVSVWLCWYFRSVLVYIILAFVVSLIGHPIMNGLKKIKIKGKSLPDGLLVITTIIAIVGIFLLFITQLIPIVMHIVRDASIMNAKDVPYNSLLERVDAWITSTFPSVGPDFDLVGFILNQIRSVLNLSNVTSLLGSVASLAITIGVGVFAVVFISFFFLKDEHLFCKIIKAIVPDKIESSVEKTIFDITHLLSRYFVGLLIEVMGVILVDFLGLWLIARIEIDYALGIAFIAGILNIIPYVGPLIGEAIGVVLCVVLKYGTGMGLNVHITAFALIVLAIMLTAQLIDNFVYQPLIYSTSIKSTPLEIFIVLLMAGHVGGTLGLLVGVPAYTVVRVIAARFFSKHKVVQRLIPDIEQENTEAIVL